MRKIIHIDMDCFYAAIEARDNPELRNKPIAVGGRSSQRGVLCTCNYEARHYGIHSAMPTAQAMRLCPDLVILPVNMAKYRKVSQAIREIFYQFTELVEPLSLDEAYLDVTDCESYSNSATWIAEAICKQIFATQHLTASAGVAPNKFLAKVASDWRKPNGQFVIPPTAVSNFIKKLPVEKITGVGKVTAQKLHDFNIYTCGDLQEIPLNILLERFSSFGIRLHELSLGEDDRSVEPNRIKKSLSVETTYPQDLLALKQCLQALPTLFTQLQQRLAKVPEYQIKKHFIKIKFNNFKTTTVERNTTQLSYELFAKLCQLGLARHQLPVRLLGLGVRFAESAYDTNCCEQLDLYK